MLCGVCCLSVWCCLGFCYIVMLGLVVCVVYSDCGSIVVWNCVGLFMFCCRLMSILCRGLVRLLLIVLECV